MNFKRTVLFFVALFCMYCTSAAYAQETASTSYLSNRWYYNAFSPKSSGISFFSAGYNYFYNNFDITIRLLDLGITKRYYAKTGITVFFSELVSLSLEYQLHYPFKVTDYKLMEHIGTFKLGWYPQLRYDRLTSTENTDTFNLGPYPSAPSVINKSGVGRMNLYAQQTDTQQSMLVFRNTSSITTMLVQLPDFLRIDAQAHFIYDYAIDHDDHLYEVFLNAPLVQDHGFGQFAFKPFVSYTNSIGDATKIKAQKNIVQHMTFILLPPAFYNFAGGAMLEYRFFFLSFLDSYQWYEDFYISATYNVAYIQDDKRDVGEVKMYYGGGIGFNLFDSMPFSVQFLMDEDNNMGFSVISSIIPTY